MPSAKLAALSLHLANLVMKPEYEALARENDFYSLAQTLLGPRFEQKYQESSQLLARHLSQNCQIVTLADPEYPALLRQIPAAPFALFALGDLSLLQASQHFAIVGTRQPSLLGIKLAAYCAAYLARQKISVVSGMARGIDSAAHRAAMNEAAGTIAILAHGADYIYPEGNREIYQKAQNGRGVLLLGEYGLGVKPQRYFFPRRNRIISGLCRRVLFAEGSEKSGAMITVRHALEQGREVYALQHDLLKNNSGGEKLLSDGAHDFGRLLKIRVSDQYPAGNLLDTLSAENSFYLGNSLWASFEPQI